MKRFYIALLGLLAATTAMAQYRCLENDKTLFTDKPCATQETSKPSQGNTPKVIGDSGNSAYTSLDGDWRGQLQYQATHKGESISAAHAIVQATISIDPQGKILGASPENGCKMKGIASPGLTPDLLSLDITLTGCTFGKFNRRLTGTLALSRAEKRTQFWIYAHPVDFLDPGWSYDIKGTLRR